MFIFSNILCFKILLEDEEILKLIQLTLLYKNQIYKEILVNRNKIKNNNEDKIEYRSNDNN